MKYVQQRYDSASRQASLGNIWCPDRLWTWWDESIKVSHQSGGEFLELRRRHQVKSDFERREGSQCRGHVRGGQVWARHIQISLGDAKREYPPFAHQMFGNRMGNAARNLVRMQQAER